MNRFFTLERRTGGRLGWLSIIGVLIIPLLVAGGFLAATWNSSDRLGKVHAAIVNNDDPVTIDNKQVPLGRQLAGSLVNGKGTDDGQNFDWQISDSSDANKGLADGRYAAVVTIPSNFSARATSYSKNHAKDAKRANLDVQTSHRSGITDAAVGRSISSAAIDGINDKLSRQYLSNLYLGFNRTQSGVQKSADGAKQLAGSSKKLSGGIHDSAGAAKKLSAGNERLSDGAGKLSTGIGKLGPGADRLASGADGLGRGTRQLSTNLDKLSDGTAQLPKQTRRLDSGARSSADGARGLRSGIGKVNKSAGQLSDGAGQLQSGLGQYSKNTKQNAAAVHSYVDGVNKYTDSVTPYVKKVGESADGMSVAAKNIKQGRGQLRSAGKQVDCPQNMSQTECKAFKKGAAATGQQVNQQLDHGKLGHAVDRLAGNSDRIKTGSQQLSNSSQKLKRSGNQLAGGADKLHNGATRMQSNAGRLGDGADKLSNGTGKLDSSAGKLANGLDRLSNGTQKLADATPQLHKGIAAAANGSKKLAPGADRVSHGAHQLSGGIGKLDKAGDRLSNGAQETATGSKKLAGGLSKLDHGSNKLSHGTSKLHKGLQRTADKMPSYNSSDRNQLSSVAAQPVHSQQPHSLFANQSTTTLLMAVALWIGGLVTYLMIRSIPAKTFTSSASSVRLALQAVLPGAVIGAAQAVILSGALTALLGLSFGQFAGLLGFSVFAGVTFAVVNHALAALLGGFGRLLSVAAVVFSAAGGLTGALPSFFATIRPFSPITPALDGMRSLVTHGPSIGSEVGVLLAWLVVGAVAGLLAVARRRMVSPESVPTVPLE